MDSFLFIGYSFKDELVLNALREIKENLPHQCKTHYRFLVEKHDIKPNDELQKQYNQYEISYYRDVYNIKTIEINNFDEIDTYLSELYNRFANHNVIICGSFRSIDNTFRTYLESLVDKICCMLYRNKCNLSKIGFFRQ